MTQPSVGDRSDIVEGLADEIRASMSADDRQSGKQFQSACVALNKLVDLASQRLSAGLRQDSKLEIARGALLEIVRATPYATTLTPELMKADKIATNALLDMADAAPQDVPLVVPPTACSFCNTQAGYTCKRCEAKKNAGAASAGTSPATPTLRKGWEITKVSGLRAMLNGYDDDAPILTQVVAGDGTAWTLFLRASDGDLCGFKWIPHNPLILTASHPDLETLPRGAQATRPQNSLSGTAPRDER